MNVGINRLINESSAAAYRSNSGIKCVFISHQKKDAPICRHIAQYIMSAGIDVYFDEFDQKEDVKKERTADKIKERIDEIDLNKTSPIEALNILYELKEIK